MNLLAERSIIGSLFMDINSITKIYDDLKPEMFQDQILQRAYFEIVKSYDIGESVNLVNICHKLSGCEFDDDTIFNAVKKCIDTVITSAEIGSYALILINAYKARRLAQIINAIRISPIGIDEQIGALMNDLEALRRSEKTRLKTLKQVVEENENDHFVDRPDIGVHIGFERLDDMLVCLEPGDVTVVGARPAVGKSALVTQIIGNMAVAGKKVALYNLEMADRQIYERMLSSQSGISLTRIRKAKYYLGDEKKKVQSANNVLRELNVYIRSGTVRPSDIRNECRNLELDCIVIDYLQLLRSDQWYSNRTSEVGGISKAIKSLSMELGVPVILLSQLNRLSEGRPDKEPNMAELRESGDVEQDASVIILIWNTDKENNSAKAAKIEKNRQGELGKVAMRFNGSLMKFEEIGNLVVGGGFIKTEIRTPFDD